MGVKAASSSISQSREYLADACAAQWTRNPLALASALAKISGNTQSVGARRSIIAPLWLDQPSADKGDGVCQHLLSFLLHTHPPIERRLVLLREMAGSAIMTDGRWLATLRPSAWQRMREWAYPMSATVLAVAITTMLVRGLG